jgi:hypothetical protein
MTASSRAFAIIIVASTAAGCAGNQRVSLPRAAKPSDPATIVHVLNRIGFGPRPDDVARVQRLGLAAFIDRQLHPEAIPDQRP